MFWSWLVQVDTHFHTAYEQLRFPLAKLYAQHQITEMNLNLKVNLSGRHTRGKVCLTVGSIKRVKKVCRDQ